MEPHQRAGVHVLQDHQQGDDLTIIRSLSRCQESDFTSQKDHNPSSENPVVSSAPVRSSLANRLKLSSNRLLSLDLLRGLAIALMITCNAQMDGAFFIMEHPDWIGFTIAGK